MTGKRAFTLFEVLAALAVIAIALVVLLRLQVINLRTVGQDCQQTAALLTAREKLAEACRPENLRQAASRGTAQRAGRTFYWQTTSRPYELAGYPPDALNALRLVSVEVRWEQADTSPGIHLHTLVADSALP
ncbi:MAG: type II secretion system protein [Sedimentisphaerales bacterium]|nr:type II secretion system protein [Sedimentisphaerales bacterium]